ncbi:hypothetical protein BKA82DRAFT_1004725, partial [Pisolithus tinctorius]
MACYSFSGVSYGYRVDQIPEPQAVSYTTCAIVERLTNSPCTFYPAAAVFGSLLLTGVLLFCFHL